MGRIAKRTVNAAVLGCVAVAWLAFDYLTKHLFDNVPVGTQLWEGIPGLLDFRLVHNTGAAWGLFGDSTFALGAFAVVFCVALLVVAHLRRDEAHPVEMVGYGMVLAGGIGNAIDRFTAGYVVDFIEATFIDFPVFNVADICVVCGAFGLCFYVGFFYDKLEGKDGTHSSAD
jgi:signal peptidase II